MSYQTKPYKIVDIIKFTEDVKLFKVKCSLNPIPGTFLEVSIPGIGECPLASCSHDKNHLFLMTKNAGNVTSAIFQRQIGQNLHIRGPYGRGFPIEKLKGKNLILVAGGTGIAPITSLISYVEQNRSLFKKVFIYFGFKDEENILLKKMINHWKKIFTVHIGLSDASVSEYEKGFVNEIMEKHKPETKDTLALMCGPEIMMELVSKELNNLGIPDEKIYWSLERRMECGFGSCGRCQIQDLYVCKDGPVFQLDQIKSRLENEKSSNEII